MNAESPDKKTRQEGVDSGRGRAYVTGSTKPDVPEWEQIDEDQGNTTISSQLAASAAPADEDEFIGRTIGDHYQILSLLGKGGMSIVYKARHTLLHQTMAVKFLLPERAIDPTLLSRFQIEAKAAFQLNHPNIARVNELGIEASQHPYIVMDFVEGQTLGDLVDEFPHGVPVERALKILCQACSGLEHAHGKNIVHRDIKPGNLILTKEGDKEVLKIVDFGIAKILHDTEGGQALTQTGEVFGSPLYMAPEQAMGKPLDGRCDVYALGCVLYEVLSGKPPFRGANILDTLTKHINDDPAELTNIPVALQLIVKKAMQKEPGDRYQTMAEFRSDMEGFLGASDTKFVPTLQMLLKLKKNRTRLVSAAVAVLVVGGTLAWAVPNLGPSPRLDHLTNGSWTWGGDPIPNRPKVADADTQSSGDSTNSGKHGSRPQSNGDGSDQSSGDGSTSGDGSNNSSGSDGQATADGQTSSDGQTVADNNSQGQGFNSDPNIAMVPEGEEDSPTRSFDFNKGKKKNSSGVATRGALDDTNADTSANWTIRALKGLEALQKNDVKAAADELSWCDEAGPKCGMENDWDYARAVSMLGDCQRVLNQKDKAQVSYTKALALWNKFATDKDPTTQKAATRNVAMTSLYLAYLKNSADQQTWDGLRTAFGDNKYLGSVRQDWSNVQWNKGNVLDAEISRIMALFDKFDPGKKSSEADKLPLQKA